MTAPADPKELWSEARREALARLGFSDLPEPVEALLPALARRHHILLLAGEGSGKEVLYALAAGEACDPASPEVQALVLSATPEAARRAARFAHALNRERALEALAWTAETGSGPEDEETPERPVAHLLAGRPGEILAESRSGRLSLAHLRLLVVDGLEALRETGGWEAAEALLDTLPSDGQKVLCALRRDRALERLAETRLPRARRWPPELLEGQLSEVGPAGPKGRPGAFDRAALHYGAGAGEEARLELLARGLRHLAAATGSDRAFVRTATEREAHLVAAALAAAGLSLADDPAEPGVVVAWDEEEAPGPGGVAALLGLPPALPLLEGVLGEAAGRLAVVEPAHVPQLEILARRAGWPLRELPGAGDAADRDAVRRFRDLVGGEIGAETMGAELLLLEPLLDEHGPLRVAAALARLLRRREAPSATARPSSGEKSVRPAWTRIYVNVGKKDGAGPGDLVGAITGETAATGAQIGKVEVRHTFSLVDVDSQIADEVISGLQGKTIRNREVTARPDREA